jgi:HEAT repeat protein
MVSWALFQIEDPAAVPALQAALHVEKNSEAEIAELRAITVLGDQALDAIRSLLESPDPEVKSMAVRALAGGHAAGPWPMPQPRPRPFP